MKKNKIKDSAIAVAVALSLASGIALPMMPSTAAYAASSTTEIFIPIDSSDVDKTPATFKVYKLFDADVTYDYTTGKDTLSNIRFVDGINEEKMCNLLYEAFDISWRNTSTIADAKLRKFAEEENMTAKAALAAEIIQEMLEGNAIDRTPSYSGEQLDEQIYPNDTSFSNRLAEFVSQNAAGIGLPTSELTAGQWKDFYSMGEGYYVIVPEKVATDAHTAATTPIFTTIGGHSKKLETKRKLPGIEKYVQEDDSGSWGSVARQTTGESLNFKVVGTLPADIYSYPTYSYDITDAPEGLDIDKESIKVYIQDGTTQEERLVYDASNPPEGSESGGESMMMLMADDTGTAVTEEEDNILQIPPGLAITLGWPACYSEPFMMTEFAFIIDDTGKKYYLPHHFSDDAIITSSDESILTGILIDNELAFVTTGKGGSVQITVQDGDKTFVYNWNITADLYITNDSSKFDEENGMHIINTGDSLSLSYELHTTHVNQDNLTLSVTSTSDSHMTYMLDKENKKINIWAGDIAETAIFTLTDGTYTARTTVGVPTEDGILLAPPDVVDPTPVTPEPEPPVIIDPEFEIFPVQVMPDLWEGQSAYISYNVDAVNTDSLVVSSSDEDILTCELAEPGQIKLNGIKPGEAVITLSDGAHSATMTISVAGVSAPVVTDKFLEGLAHVTVMEGTDQIKTGSYFQGVMVELPERLIVSFDNLLKHINSADDKVIVTYSAKVTGTSDETKENGAFVTYSSNPLNTNQKSTSAKAITNIYNYKFNLMKTDINDQLKQGATFSVQTEDGKYITVDSTGKVLKEQASDTLIALTYYNKGAYGKAYMLDGLDSGKYTITELSSPSGLNKLFNSFTLTIDDDGAVKVEASELDKDKVSIIDPDMFRDVLGSIDITGNTVQVKNTKGIELPITGQQGFTLISIAGGILLIIVLASTLRNRKKKTIKQ